MAAHRVAALGFDGMSPFELGVATEVFALPRPELDVAWWYSFALCAERPGRLSAVGGFGLDVRHGLSVLERADTILLPGSDPSSDPPARTLNALRRAHARGARLVSICSGAFILAATGLLDGKKVSTHWRYAASLKERFPAVTVDADTLYTQEDGLFSSAGTAAGIDLCLHLVRLDHGAEIANRVARRMVVAAHRDGGQRQFIEQSVPQADGDNPNAVAMEYAEANLSNELDVSSLARVACLSSRQFTRRFRSATGLTPGRWLIQRRVAASLPLLERDLRGVETIARDVGFTTPSAFRKQFRTITGLSPTDYRRRFLRATPAGHA